MKNVDISGLRPWFYFDRLSNIKVTVTLQKLFSNTTIEYKSQLFL